MSDEVMESTVTRESSNLPPGAIPGGMGGYITPIRDSGRARELQRLSTITRRERFEASLRAGVRDAFGRIPDMPAGTKPSALAVMRRITEEHALNAYDAGARGSAASFELISKGWPKPAQDKGGASGASGLTIHLDAETAQRLVDRLIGERGEGGEDE